MDLKGTQTEKNLLLAYTAESNNRNLYTFFGDRAREEGYEQIAAIFFDTANHEHEHARQVLNLIGTSDIQLPAVTFPVKGIGDTAANLQTAVSGEHYETTIMYPDFAKTGDEEHFPEVARMLRHIGTVEAYHEVRFRALLKNVKEGKVFRRDRAVRWRCRVCGYGKEDKEAPDICPICAKGRAFFEVSADKY